MDRDKELMQAQQAMFRHLRAIIRAPAGSPTPPIPLFARSWYLQKQKPFTAGDARAEREDRDMEPC